MAKKLMVLAGMMAALVMASGALAGDFTIKAQAVGCEVDDDSVCYTVDITLVNETGQDITDIKIQGGTAAWVTVSDDDDFVQAATPKGKGLPAKSGKAVKNQNVILVDNIEMLADGESKVYTVIVCGAPPVAEDGAEAECPNVLGSFTASGKTAGEEEGELVEIAAVVEGETDVFETPEILSCDEAFDCGV